MAYLDYALIEKSTLGDIGDAIREKTGGVKLLDPVRFASEIKRIPSEVDKVPLQDKTVTENGEVIADEGYYGLGTVVVNVETEFVEPILQEKTITKNGEVTPDEGYDGLGKVIVKVEGGNGGGESVIDRSIVNYQNDNLTQIGKYAFAYCLNLENVDCPNVTFVDQYAFRECNKLETVLLPELDTVEDYAFYYCKGLKSVNFPKLKNVDTNGQQFYYCESLTDVNLPLVEYLGQYMFYNCTSLESIYLPNVTGASNNVFYYCTNLKNIDLPNLEYISGGSVFGYCNALTELELPSLYGFNSSYYTFGYMTNLKHLRLPSLKSISGASRVMYYNNNMETIEVPNLETISNATEVFSSSMFNISLPSIKSITNSSKVFYSTGCDFNIRRVDLGHIQTITSKSTSSSDDVFNYLYNILALIIRTESVVDITSGISLLNGYSSYRHNYYYIYVPSSVIDDYKSTYSENAQLFRAIEDYPDVCVTEWDRSFASVVTYHAYMDGERVANYLVGKGENPLQIGNDILDGVNAGGKQFVGWCNTIDVTGEEDIITECIVDGRDINLHALYKTPSWFICYVPNRPPTMIDDFSFYELPYLRDEGNGGTYTDEKCLPTIITIPVEPDESYIGAPFVGWGLHDEDDFTNLSNGDGTITMDYLNCGNIEPMYNEGITFIYKSGNEYNESQSVMHDRYYKPYSNKYQSLNVTMPDNTFVNPGYKFVAWENRQGTYTRYQPGDAFTVSSSYYDSINTEVTFIAIWEKETI